MVAVIAYLGSSAPQAEPTPTRPSAAAIEEAVARELAKVEAEAEAPSPGPGTQATVEAQIQATVEALQTTPTPVSTPAPTNTPTPTGTPEPANTPTPAGTPEPAGTPTPTNTPTPAPAAAPTPILPHDLRHAEEKRYMLELMNAERIKASVRPVVLGDNLAAQLHAEASLENCFSSHWGIDGLKPYMRYSLAGDYQSNSENVHGRDYCIRESDGYQAIDSIRQEISEAIRWLMDSPGHRRNILDPWHRKVNVGLAWDRYNLAVVQHFEGDYLEYDPLPLIEDGGLAVSGTVKNGVTLQEDQDLGIQIYYDPPPHALTKGQVARTYCYGSGLLIASLRPPLSGNWFYSEDSYTTSYRPCPDPYDVPADAAAPRSHDEALQSWQAAYDASQAMEETTSTVPWITAGGWEIDGDSFEVTAGIGGLLSRHGAGVYTILVWGEIGGEDVIISEYSLFHGVTPPDTYD